jgi:hypothetical protein
MRFGLILGWLAILKKKMGADYEQLLRLVFSYFRGQKNAIFKKKTLFYNISFIIILFLFKKKIFGNKYAKYSQSFVYCSTRDTYLHDFYIMTLQITQ